MHNIGSILLIVCAVMSLTFVVGYHLTTDWRATEVGKHLMAFTASESAILTMYSARIIAGADAPWFEFVRLIVFISFPVVLGWRLAIMWRFSVKPWMEARRDRNDDGNGDGYLDDRGRRARGPRGS